MLACEMSAAVWQFEHFGIVILWDCNESCNCHMDAAMKMESGEDRAHPRKMLVKISNKAHVDGVAMLLDAMAMRVFKWDKLGSRLQNKRKVKTAEAEG